MKGRNKATEVRIEKVQRRDLVASVTASGQVQPHTKVDIIADISGRIVRAHRNLLEIFPQFAAALFVVHAGGAEGRLSVLGAWLFFFARCLYVPAYAFGPAGGQAPSKAHAPAPNQRRHGYDEYSFELQPA